MLHGVRELAEEPVLRKPVEAWEVERTVVRYCIEVMSRMQRYSIKFHRSRSGWLVMTVCEREAG